jgi:hypothetical protein
MDFPWSRYFDELLTFDTDVLFNSDPKPAYTTMFAQIVESALGTTGVAVSTTGTIPQSTTSSPSSSVETQRGTTNVGTTSPSTNASSSSSPSTSSSASTTSPVHSTTAAGSGATTGVEEETTSGQVHVEEHSSASRTRISRALGLFSILLLISAVIM